MRWGVPESVVGLPKAFFVGGGYEVGCTGGSLRQSLHG